MEWFEEMRECRYMTQEVPCGKQFLGTKTSKYCADHAAQARREKHRIYVKRQNALRKALRAIGGGGVPLPTGKGR